MGTEAWGLRSGGGQDTRYRAVVRPTCCQHGHVLCQAAREDAGQLGEEAEAALAGPDTPLPELLLQGLDHERHLSAGGRR